MRSFIFNVLFYSLSAVFAILCVLLSLIPGRKPIMLGLGLYTRTMMVLMRVVAGIKIAVTGHDKLPKQGPYIIASKHQSYGDGFVMFSQFKDLSFVTGDHLDKFMTIKHIFKKMGAVVIDSCGGTDARGSLQKKAEAVRAEGRKLLIYPEGHLSQIGTHHRYRKGVFYMYKDFDCPVVPVAANLGQRWNQNQWEKFPGPAQVEFLDPIPPGLEKKEFMQELQNRIETRSLEMLDMKNLGALNPDDIGKLSENQSARDKRLSKKQNKEIQS